MLSLNSVKNRNNLIKANHPDAIDINKLNMPWFDVVLLISLPVFAILGLIYSSLISLY